MMDFTGTMKVPQTLRVELLLFMYMLFYLVIMRRTRFSLANIHPLAQKQKMVLFS